uniref:Uncharacterized protein n=1 Tax=Oryza punctata TaxID=4537 RepID=A0A0E0MD35_ORYPU
MATAGGAPTAWRSAAVAICLLPVILPLALLCLPLLCFAVTVVRFRRRRRLRMAARKGKASGCRFFVGGSEERLSPEKDEGDGNRAALLQQYLVDQMELVGGGGAEVDEGKKASALIGHENQELS